MQPAVLLLCYNRADLVEAQLSRLLNDWKCQKVFVSVDGPKAKPDDIEAVTQVQAVIERFQKKYPKALRVQLSPKNLGCQKGVEKGIDWFFSQVEEGLILEDDCYPHPDFLQYCQDLLEKYRDDQRVGMISGCNPLVQLTLKSDYFFSHQSIIWGWATWKRAWQSYHSFKAGAKKIFGDPPARQRLLKLTTAKHLKTLTAIIDGQIDTWDYIWYFTNLTESRFCVIPTHNLVSNVGFANRATHTKIKTSQAALPFFAQHFPLRSPGSMLANQEFEDQYLAQLKPWNLAKSIIGAYLPRVS